MTSPLQALRSGALAMAGTQRRTSFGKVFDLNSSGGTAASQSSPEQVEAPKQPTSSKLTTTADKNDESYVAEYYARAQLANAKMVRQLSKSSNGHPFRQLHITSSLSCIWLGK